MLPVSSRHVFISYSRRDSDAMLRIVQYLRGQGIKVWVDNERLIPGTPIWEEEIEVAISGAFAIVVVLSPDAKKSEWVRREIALADQFRKRVFPVLVAGSDEESIPLRLITRQFVDLRKGEAASLNSLKTAILAYGEELTSQDEKQRAEAERLARIEQAAEKAKQEAIEREALRLGIERKARKKAERRITPADARKSGRTDQSTQETGQPEKRSTEKKADLKKNPTSSSERYVPDPSVGEQVRDIPAVSKNKLREIVAHKSTRYAASMVVIMVIALLAVFQNLGRSNENAPATATQELPSATANPIVTNTEGPLEPQPSATHTLISPTATPSNVLFATSFEDSDPTHPASIKSLVFPEQYLQYEYAISSGSFPQNAWTLYDKANTGRYSVNVVPGGNPNANGLTTISSAVLEPVFDVSGYESVNLTLWMNSTSNPDPNSISNCGSNLSVLYKFSQSSSTWEHKTGICGQYETESLGWIPISLDFDVSDQSNIQFAFVYEFYGTGEANPNAYFLVDDILITAR